MALAFNLLHYTKKKLLLSGVSQSAMEYFGSKYQRGIGKLLSSVGFWTVLEILLITGVQYLCVGYLNVAFGKLVNTGANYFGLLFFAPILELVVCLVLRIDPLAQMDLITPAYPLALIFVKIACYTADCCKGVAWIEGFSAPIIIPVQLIESAAALLLFIFLMLYKGKMKKGTVFPIYLMVYSAVRFFTEHFRCEPKVFLGLRTYQLLCLAGIAVGVLEYAAVCGYQIYRKHKLEQKNAENDTVTENN